MMALGSHTPITAPSGSSGPLPQAREQSGFKARIEASSQDSAPPGFWCSLG